MAGREVHKETVGKSCAKTVLVSIFPEGHPEKTIMAYAIIDDQSNTTLASEAVDLLKRTQEALKENGNLRLCKIASNSCQVMEAFHQEDRAKDLKDLDLGSRLLPIQRSLGFGWDLCTDSFKFIVSRTEKPYTKRGILSTVNSVYDPLGFVAPITVQGKILLRELISGSKDWDEPLPSEHEPKWMAWKELLGRLETLTVPRMYLPGVDYSGPKEVHIFSDSSEKAIAAVAYMRSANPVDQGNLGFIIGKAKVAPTTGHTIPRLELCAAVLAVEIGELVSEQLDIPLNCFHFYTDCRVVLGYIHNRTRRFYIYVANRVERIHKSTKPEQWKYVPTDLNPADHGTRPSNASTSKVNSWLLEKMHHRTFWTIHCLMQTQIRRSRQRK
ncbi:uncharacterized protein LOC124263006 [Haliotis rubra]|uniref:uncharacterized protein LOC124263006 n=1 Tax=Haliotis rubra TaxID=36100 RepID=UPI001EE547A0|nr:uncharacterized protein LOC124263006 [Haliotis rubra]